MGATGLKGLGTKGGCSRAIRVCHCSNVCSGRCK